MNQELAGGTLGIRAAEAARRFNQPEAWSTITTGNGIYQINRYTGEWRKIPIPVTSPKKLIKTWNPKTKMYEWNYAAPGLPAGPAESEAPKLIKTWDPTKNAYVWRKAEPGLLAAPGEQSKKERRLTPKEEYSLKSEALKGDRVAAETYNDFQSDDSTKMIYYKARDYMPDVAEEVQLPNIGGFQITVGYLRRVQEKYGLPSLSDALDFVKQANTPVGRSRRHKITAFGE